MEEEGEPRALRVHWESLPCWPRGLVTAATQRSFIRGLTREMLTHCYAHQSGDRDANYLFTNRSFRSLSGRAPDSVCRRICSYQGKCPGEGGSALSDWAGPPHPERGPEQLHTLCWRLLLAPPHSFPPGSFRASPTSAHTCPHLILPLPTSVHTCPTPAHTCPHLILPLPISAHICPTPAHTCPHLILPLPISAHTCDTPAHTCPCLILPLPTSAHTCPTPDHT